MYSFDHVFFLQLKAVTTNWKDTLMDSWPRTLRILLESRINRPFPSSPQPSFQIEAKCEDLKLKLELITITKISHLDSL